MVLKAATGGVEAVLRQEGILYGQAVKAKAVLEIFRKNPGATRTLRRLENQRIPEGKRMLLM